MADPGSLAFEEGRWEDVIDEYREILAENPDDRLSWLRIAQAQRELGRHEIALDSLEAASAVQAPPAMVELERARNLAALGRSDEALGALEISDHEGLRALDVLEEAEDFDALRNDSRFRQVVRNVRDRVYPCESIPEASRFDFWVGEWEVRNPDGDLVGRNTVRRILGGCVLHESWTGTDGSTGESLNIYDARAGAWHQTWVDNSGLLLELNGELAGDAMVLRGELPAPDGGASLQRITWTPADDGSVRQLWERSTDGAASWSTVFDGIYRRVGPEGDDDADG